MKKIMFNDRYGLTSAVLEGRKTMTRRIVPEGTPFGNWEETLKKSRYQVGEVVAVAQKYEDVLDEFIEETYRHDEPTPDNFKPFGSQSEVTLPRTLPGWGNKMFVHAELMPHQIRITSIRVERLQEISEADCLREGIYKKTLCPPGVDYFYHSEPRSKWDVYPSPREAFAGLIDKVSGKETWERNPWVFVYEFELIK